MELPYSTLDLQFKDAFSGKPLLIKAPGRINLLGEHVDYNLGWVLPAAIDKEIIFAIGISETDQFKIIAGDLNETISFSANEIAPGKGWGSYLMGVIQGIKNYGKELPGVNCVFGGNIPNGAGLSSSAALCCGFAFALNELFKLNLSTKDLALIARFAEHEFAGVKCGLMDQYASLFSRKDYLLHLDCQSLTYDYVPFVLPDLDILLIDTCVKHDLVTSAYNARRESCENGVQMLNQHYGNVNSLRDVTSQQLTAIRDYLDADTFFKCHYVLEEMQRVAQGIVCLKENDLAAFGQLMYMSHEGLKNKYEVSCAELDFLVEVAHTHKVVGSRMMGGGFGGCTINLIAKVEKEPFKSMVLEKYGKRFGVTPSFYEVNTADGVRVISS